MKHCSKLNLDITFIRLRVLIGQFRLQSPHPFEYVVEVLFNFVQQAYVLFELEIRFDQVGLRQRVAIHEHLVGFLKPLQPASSY